MDLDTDQEDLLQSDDDELSESSFSLDQKNKEVFHLDEESSKLSLDNFDFIGKKSPLLNQESFNEERLIANFEREQDVFLTQEQYALSQGKEPRKRHYLPTLHARGTFFDVGYAIGRTFRAAISDSVNKKFPGGDKTLKFYESVNGKELYNKFLATCLQLFPQYIKELKGIAEGSGISFSKLFILQIGTDIMKPSSAKSDICGFSGSTTLVINKENELVGHIVDQVASSLGNAFVVRVMITEDKFYHEEFTAVCIGGSLPGWEFAVNKYGLAFCANSIKIRKHNPLGIPKRILCRALLSAQNMDNVKSILLCKSCGIADAMSITCTFVGSTERIFYNIEVAPPAYRTSMSQMNINIIKKGENFYHLNGFMHMDKWHPKCDEDIAVWNRLKEKRLENFQTANNLEELLSIMGDSGDCHPFKNLFSISDHTFCSIFVGVLDFKQRIMTIYMDNPKDTVPYACISF